MKSLVCPRPSWLAAVAAIFTLPSLAAQALAFPGAVGFGAQATGGRGGTIYHVTNLNDSGLGSFRDAVSQPNRIVVFDTGGYVQLQSPVIFSSNLTILGQTAPGGGIGMMGRELSLSAKTNIVMRGVRARQGLLDPDTGKSALNMGTATNIMLDHCSFAYGQWDTVDAVGTQNFTVSNSIIADPIGQQFGAHVETGPSTFYRNLWVNAHNRQPLAKDNTIYVNNVVYDFELGYTTGNTGGHFQHDLVNNYFITGPMTTTPSDAWFQVDSYQTVYAAGNYLDSAPNGVLDGAPDNTIDAAGVYLTTPWSPLTSTIPTLSAAAAYTSVVASAGAWPRDAVDQFVLSDVNSLGTRGQLYKDQSLTGLANDGYGTINPGTPFLSSAGSGIPDYWAQANGISTSDPNAGTALYGSTGYTNVEVYANSLILPDSWGAGDLAGTPVQGASSYNPFTSQWLLTGSGVNAGSAITQGQFASEPWPADGVLSARVATLNGATAQAVAGVMVSGAVGSGTSYVALVQNGSGGLRFIAQDASTGQVQGTSLRRVPAGVWLQLAKLGGSFAASYSTDGTTWTTIATASVAMPSTAAGGLVMSSGSTSALGTATFSNVSMGSSLK